MDALTRRVLDRPSGKKTMIYASRLMKGHYALRAVKDFKAQEAIQPTTRRILQETR